MQGSAYLASQTAAELHLISCAQAQRISSPGWLKRASFQMPFQIHGRLFAYAPPANKSSRVTAVHSSAVSSGREWMSQLVELKASIISAEPIILHNSGSLQILVLLHL